jgi:non-specific serine/threonine protein kinase
LSPDRCPFHYLGGYLSFVVDYLHASEALGGRGAGDLRRAGRSSMTLAVRAAEQRGDLLVAQGAYIPRPQDDAVARALDAPGLIVLTGTGGVGKTRVAVQAARSWASSPWSTVWLVDLSSVRDDAAVARAAADSVRVSTSAAGPTEALARFIGADQVLLVLDNCEHVLRGCRDLVGGLLAGCPNLRILATSRAPLDLAGERVVPVEPMATPEPDRAPESVEQFASVALFVDCALRARPGLSLTPDALELIGRICARLDGLPLAIELAAARTRVLSLAQLEERLDDRFPVLAGRNRPGPQRTQTLSACIGWSWDLCTAAEQTLWARLSAFPDGCELDAIEGTCDGGGVAQRDILDLVESLIDQSILTRVDRGGEPRYRMLESVREFGAQHLAERGETATLTARQRDWYAQLLERAERDWASTRQGYWLARMYREASNLRQLTRAALDDADPAAALRLLVPAWRICWWALGRNDELRGWLDEALARAADEAPESPLRGRALLILAYMAAIQRRPEQGAAALDEGRRIAALAQDRVGLALAAAADGLGAEARNDAAGSIAGYLASLEQLAELPLIGQRIYVMGQLAAAYERAGDADRAADALDAALALSAEHGESFERGLLLFAVGVAAWTRGDIGRAEDLVTQCLRLKVELDDRIGIALAGQMLASTAFGAGDAERAAALIAVAPALWHSAGAQAASLPSYVRIRDETAALARASLGDAAYDAITASGSRIGAQGAIAFALRERSFAEVAPHSLEALTSREREVAHLIARGLTNRDIASRLVISVRTAEGHAERIRAKLGVASRRDIARYVQASLDPN